jgi:16S rRNA (cytidine1402-2'-O)-methyltransferase
MRWLSQRCGAAISAAFPCGATTTARRALLLAPTPARRFTNKRSRYQEKVGVPTADGARNPLAKPASIDPGALHIVSVPIGNLKDFSLRALEVLKHVDYIVCIDRETTKILLDLIDITTSGRLIHYREDSGNAQLITMLKEGKSMALVAPSGTPCVGDKGTSLVREMLREGIRVTSVPGPSSIVAALSVSGMSVPSGCFFFGSFLPEQHAPRLQMLKSIASLTHPSVFFALPRSLLAALQDLAILLPRRRVALVHEATKLHESLHCDVAEKLAAFYTSGDAAVMLKKGQVVLIVEGDLPSARTDHVGLKAEADAAGLHRMVRDQLAAAEGSVFAPPKTQQRVDLAMKVVSTVACVPLREVQQAYASVEAWDARAQRRVAARLAADAAQAEATPVDAAQALAAQKRDRRKARRLALVARIEAQQEALRLQLLSQRAKATQ